MKTLIWYGATVVMVGVAATMSGQSEFADASSSSSSYIQTSKLVGRKVQSSQGKEIGVIKDIVIDRTSGYIAYTVVSTGGEGTGVADGGGKMVAVPWAVFSPTSDLNVLTVSVDRDKIYNAPPFEYARMDEYARPDYINNVYSYYGVSPGPRVAAASKEAKAGTDVTGTAGATVSPGEVASSAAAPAGTGSPNQKPSARAHASSGVSSSETSSAKPSRATRNARAVGGHPSIDGDETDSSVTTEKAPSESATNPNEKSRRKAIEGTSIRRPSRTPEPAEDED